MVLLEAMHFGKPTIVSSVDGSGMSWVVEHGETGLHVAPGDTEGLADALRRLLAAGAGRVAMGRRGRDRFERLFHIDRSSAGVLEVYQAALTRPHQPAGPQP